MWLYSGYIDETNLKMSKNFQGVVQIFSFNFQLLIQVLGLYVYSDTKDWHYARSINNLSNIGCDLKRGTSRLKFKQRGHT